MVFPFLTLQMVSIGLNLSDVALITALVQVVSFLATPIASKSIKQLRISSKINFKIKFEFWMCIINN